MLAVVVRDDALGRWGEMAVSGVGVDCYCCYSAHTWAVVLFGRPPGLAVLPRRTCTPLSWQMQGLEVAAVEVAVDGEVMPAVRGCDSGWQRGHVHLNPDGQTGPDQIHLKSAAVYCLFAWQAHGGCAMCWQDSNYGS